MKRFLSFLLLLSFLLPVQAEEILQEIVVAPNETMWSIANKYLKDPKKWPEISKYNDLPTPDPTVALPGMKLKVPITLIKEEFRNAELLNYIPVVRYKRKGSEDWREVNPNMTLKYEDSIRTLSGANARVRFATREIVVIEENSYVVLKPEKILQEIELFQGGVRASQAKIILPQGTVVQPRGINSDYQAKIRDDQTEVVFVHKGKVDVTAQGKTVTIPEGFGTHVLKSAPPSTPQPLREFPDYNPETFKNIPSGLPFKKNKNETVTIVPPKNVEKKSGNGGKSVVSNNIFSTYHLQLAKEPEFKTIILEKSAPIGTPFDVKTEDVPDGIYYTRVAFVDALGVKGDFSKPAQVIRDTQAPQITSLTPANGDTFYGDDIYCTVMGIVSGATAISVNNDVVFIDQEGRFSKLLTLKEGVNEIRIIARDTSDNETIEIRKVTYSKRK